MQQCSLTRHLPSGTCPYSNIKKDHNNSTTLSTEKKTTKISADYIFPENEERDVDSLH
jgi:hypothetical protein